MLGVRLYIAQRLTAMLLAPLVVVHVAMMIYAVQGGLDAAEILGRTRGSVGWGLMYGLFVAAAAVHGAIGLRVVVHEHLKLSGRPLDAFTVAVGSGLAVLGGRAVLGVVL